MSLVIVVPKTSLTTKALAAPKAASWFTPLDLNNAKVSSEFLKGLKIGLVAGTLGAGGAERQLYYILKSLVAAEAQPELLCLTRGEHWEGPIRDLGVPITWVGERRGIIARLRRITAEVKRIRPDVLQSMHFFTNSYVGVVGRWLGIKTLGAVRSDIHSELREMGRIFGPICLKAPHLVAANSLNAIRNATKMGLSADRMIFLPNAIDLTDGGFSDSSDSHQCRDHMRILTVGRLDQGKRIDWFLRLMANLVSQGFQVRGAIAGDGPERSHLQTLATQLGLTPDKVTFLGQVRNMSEVYSSADVFVLTSSFEGTPNVVLEAMASGLPVVSTDVGDVPDIIAHEVSGLVVDQNDEVGVQMAVTRLVRDPEMRGRLGQAARGTIERDWSIDRLAKRLTNLYADAISPPLRTRQ